MARANRPNMNRTRAEAYRRRERLDLLGAYAFGAVAVGLFGALWCWALFHPGWWL